MALSNQAPNDFLSIPFSVLSLRHLRLGKTGEAILLDTELHALKLLVRQRICLFNLRIRFRAFRQRLARRHLADERVDDRAEAIERTVQLRQKFLQHARVNGIHQTLRLFCIVRNLTISTRLKIVSDKSKYLNGTAIAELRTKLGEAGNQIETVRGVGYRMESGK